MTTVNDVDAFLEIYCGMGLGGIIDLQDLKTGKADRLHPNTIASMRWRELVEQDTKALSAHGLKVLHRGNMIIRGVYEYPSSALEGAKYTALENLELRGLSRLEPCKNAGIKSDHLKALRSLVLRPGQSRAHLARVYGGPALERLESTGMLIGGGHRKHDQVYPATKAYAFMLRIMELVS